MALQRYFSGFRSIKHRIETVSSNNFLHCCVFAVARFSSHFTEREEENKKDWERERESCERCAHPFLRMDWNVYKSTRMCAGIYQNCMKISIKCDSLKAKLMKRERDERTGKWTNEWVNKCVYIVNTPSVSSKRVWWCVFFTRATMLDIVTNMSSKPPWKLYQFSPKIWWYQNISFVLLARLDNHTLSML